MNHKIYVSNKDVPGVYIIRNIQNGKVYVGESEKVFKRGRQHFTKKGNAFIMQDYLNGNDFGIKVITLKNSGYTYLNALERHSIIKYDAVRKGYNRNSGNKTELYKQEITKGDQASRHGELFDSTFFTRLQNHSSIGTPPSAFP